MVDLKSTEKTCLGDNDCMFLSLMIEKLKFCWLVQLAGLGFGVAFSGLGLG